VTTPAWVGKYTRFDDSPDSTHNQLVQLVPRGARVLEFGCATGYMSRVLCERLGCSVTGIEVDSAAAEIARGFAARVIVGDAEQLDYVQVFESERFDVVLFADVLEHLRDPQAVLRRVRPLLAEGGFIVASLPNVAHGSLRLALLGGDFRYTPTGLLDDTHLRFFTQESLLTLFEQAGYVIVEWQRKRTPIDQTEVRAPDATLPDSVLEHIETDPEATTYQFVVRARRVEEVEQLHSVQADLGALHAEVEARDSALRRLQDQLAQQTEAAVTATRQVAERESTVRELQELIRDRTVVRRELNAVSKQVRDQAGLLSSLVEQVARTADMQEALERSFETARHDVLARHDDVQGTLYDLSARMSRLRPAADGLEEADRGYQQMIRRVQEMVRIAVPRGATIVVASRGDDALLSLYGRTAWHFPCLDDGSWAGEYPATSIAAIAQLETLRAIGAEFLLFPKPATWWLDFYTELRRYLERRYRLVFRRDDAGALYDLRRPAHVSHSVWHLLEQTVATVRTHAGYEPAILDWNTRRELADRFPLLTVFSPPSRGDSTLPYLDRTIELVALASDDPALQAEARRVAKTAVLTFARTPDAGDVGLDVAWLNANDGLQPVSSTTVSIVIPCYNNVALTKACLRAVQETLPSSVGTSIIVVDDASTDETPRALRELAAADDRLRILRNTENLGFIRSCNRGAEVAQGDLLVFLNNDTLPLAGWLEAIIELFRDRPDAGAVGGKLLYPDGRLQEAGGVIFFDGSAANVGRGQYDADAPMFNFVRDVDYCSGALLATPRMLFTALGGFDTRYAPAYYEDADYCFGVRERGYRVYYQPRSVIVHGEGASSGIDLLSGVKRFQVLNQATFAEKWANALQHHPRHPSTFDSPTWYALVRRSRDTSG
jgi:GT2 family glycosyltransferase/2-polyprenyl-3-methyl-5-hydroxy-6-metoxy-1,4-benzoquinol methylase